MYSSMRLQTLWYFCIGLILVIYCTRLGANASSTISVDARILGWAKASAARGDNWRMVEKLEDMNYKHPPYSTRYPQLVKILEDESFPKAIKLYVTSVLVTAG